MCVTNSYRGGKRLVGLRGCRIRLPDCSVNSRVCSGVKPIYRSCKGAILLVNNEHTLGTTRRGVHTCMTGAGLRVVNIRQCNDSYACRAMRGLHRLSICRGTSVIFNINNKGTLSAIGYLYVASSGPIFAFPAVTSGYTTYASMSVVCGRSNAFLGPGFFVQPTVRTFVSARVVTGTPTRCV